MKKKTKKKAAATRKQPKAVSKKPKAAARKVPAKKKPVAARKAPVAARKAPVAARKAPASARKAPAAARKAPAAARTKKKASAARKTSAARRTSASPPAAPVSSRASQSALDVSRQLPEERALTDEEREAMSKVAQTALVAVGATGEPSLVVAGIASYVDDIRKGNRPMPTSQDVRLGLGVLWGEQVRAQVGWRWVHLSYPNGFASYALVPDDRAFACFPLNRVSELLTRGTEGTNTSVPLFESIRASHLPTRRGNSYLVIG